MKHAYLTPPSPTPSRNYVNRILFSFSYKNIRMCTHTVKFSRGACMQFVYNKVTCLRLPYIENQYQ